MTTSSRSCPKKYDEENSACKNFVRRGNPDCITCRDSYIRVMGQIAKNMNRPTRKFTPKLRYENEAE